MKVAIYANIACQPGQDSELQLDQLCHLAPSNHAEVQPFVDRQTDKTSARPQFQKLFQSAARHEFEVVLVWALDRFVGENVAETFGNIQKLLRYGVQFESATEPHFRTTGPAGALMLPIATWIVQQERIRISERTKAGPAKVRLKGKRLGRPGRVFLRGRVAADRKRGMSWRQLERKYGVPRSTLRDALATPAEAGGPPPPDAGELPRRCGEEASQ